MTKYNIIEATNLEANSTVDKLSLYNQRMMPCDEERYQHNFNFVIKDTGEQIIAGINTILYACATLSFDILWVDEAHAGQGIGTMLLNHVEDKAKALGAHLSVLHTHDYQAKDFYIKHGYEIFGVLDDCPVPGRKRYHMKKEL